MLTVTLYTALGLFVYMTLFFVIAQALKNNVIVDVAWGGGFILVAALNLVMAKDVAAR